MVKTRTIVKYSGFHVNYFTLQSRYNVKVSFQVMSPNVMLDANVLSLYLLL